MAIEVIQDEKWICPFLEYVSDAAKKASKKRPHAPTIKYLNVNRTIPKMAKRIMNTRLDPTRSESCSCSRIERVLKTSFGG